MGGGRFFWVIVIPKNDAFQSARSIDPGFTAGEQTIATRFRIVTTAGERLTATVAVNAALSTASAARTVRSNKPRALLDEQFVDVQLDFESYRGDRRNASGPGEFMATSRESR